MNITTDKSIANIKYEYARDTDGRIVSIKKVNPIITIDYSDGTTAIMDTNLIYRNGYEDGYERGKEEMIKKFKNMFEDEDESM